MTLDIASVFRSAQIGLETTHGVPVPANKELLSLMIQPGIQADTKSYRPSGRKYNTVTVPGKQWIQGSYNGPLTFTDIVYPFSSVCTTPVITTIGTTGRRWVYTPLSKQRDTPKSFTIESGSPDRAFRFNHTLFTSFQLQVTRDELKVSGNIMGRDFEDNITLTPSPVPLELLPAEPADTSLYIVDHPSEFATADPWLRGFTFDWSLGDRYSPVWEINKAQQSWASFVEKAPKLDVKLSTAANADGMALYETMQTGATKFIRCIVEGPEFETGFSYLFQIDTACQVAQIGNFGDTDGVFSIDYTFTGVDDSAFGKAFQVTVQNKIASL